MSPEEHNRQRERVLAAARLSDDLTERHAAYPLSLWSRFWSKVEKTDSCWLWRASLTSSGYGQINIDGRPIGAHRVAYELLRGPIPEGLQIDHLCRVRTCVNPDHLETVTQAENLARGMCATATHCKRGHPFDEENTYYKLGGGRECRTCQRERRARWGRENFEHEQQYARERRQRLRAAREEQS